MSSDPNVRFSPDFQKAVRKARDNHRFQFKGNQYHNFDAENNNGYEPRIKKSRVSSEHSSHGHEFYGSDLKNILE